MKTFEKMIQIGTVILGIVVVSSTAQAKESKNDAAGVKTVKISAEKAMEITNKHIKGTIAKVEFEDEQRGKVWEVETLDSSGKVYDVKIDANSGKILAQKLDKDDKEDEDEED